MGIFVRHSCMGIILHKQVYSFLLFTFRTAGWYLELGTLGNNELHPFPWSMSKGLQHYYLTLLYLTSPLKDDEKEAISSEQQEDGEAEASGE